MKNWIFVIFLVFISQTTIANEENRQRLYRLAEAGNSDAMYAIFVEVGTRAQDDRKVTDDEFEQSTNWLIKAGNLNNWQAAYVLQMCYKKGCAGLEIDDAKAKHYESIFTKHRPNK